MNVKKVTLTCQTPRLAIVLGFFFNYNFACCIGFTRGSNIVYIVITVYSNYSNISTKAVLLTKNYEKFGFGKEIPKIHRNRLTGNPCCRRAYSPTPTPPMEPTSSSSHLLPSMETFHSWVISIGVKCVLGNGLLNWIVARYDMRGFRVLNC